MPTRRANLIALCVITITSGLVYFGSLGNGFVADDRYLVVDNLKQSTELSWSDLFTNPWGAGAGSEFDQRMNQGYYRPLAMGLIRIENAVFGEAQTGYHAVGVLLHMLASAFVFLLSRRLLTLTGAITAGILFAVHSIHTEAVNVIFYQTTLLVAVFTFLSLWIYSFEVVETRKRVVIWLLFVLALLCKETAVLIPLLLFLFDVFFRRASIKTLFSPFFLVLAATGVAYLVFRSSILTGGGFSYFENTPVWSRILTMGGVFNLYIKLIIWPYPLCPFYEWSIIPPVADPFGRFAVIGVITVAGYFIALAFVLRKWRLSRIAVQESTSSPSAIVGFSLCFFFATLLPVLHLIPILNVAAERFVYLGSFSFCLLIGFSFQSVLQKVRRSTVRVGASIVIGFYLVMLCVITVSRNNDWYSDETLSRATLADYPMSLNARMELTKILLKQEKYSEALKHARKARKQAPSISAVIDLEAAAIRALGSSTDDDR